MNADTKTIELIAQIRSGDHGALNRLAERELLSSWESEAPGALRAFLRKAVANHVVEETRKARHRSGSPEPLEALAQISESDRRLLAARFGSGYRYARVAERLGRPSANAARVGVERVARVMKRNRQVGSIH